MNEVVLLAMLREIAYAILLQMYGKDLKNEELLRSIAFADPKDFVKLINESKGETLEWKE